MPVGSQKPTPNDSHISSYRFCLYQPLTMISLDRIGDIHTFVQIVQAGNLSAAAQRLDLSLAAVSKRLSRLERTLGCRLLERTTRKSSLTEAGRDFYHHGVALLGHAEQAQKVVQSRQRGMRGLLKVGASSTFARHQIVPRLPRLLARHPALKIELVGLDDSADRPHPDIDVAIRWQRPAPRHGLASLELGLDQLVLCAAPTYLEQYGRPRTPADLSSHRWVLCGRPAQHGWPPVLEHAEDFSDVQWSTQAGSWDLAQTAVLAGLGIAAQSLRDAADAGPAANPRSRRGRRRMSPRAAIRPPPPDHPMARPRWLASFSYDRAFRHPAEQQAHPRCTGPTPQSGFPSANCVR